MKNTKTNNPFPVRLGNKKAALQKQAAEADKSLHRHINKILDLHLEKTDPYWNDIKTTTQKS